MDGEHDLEFYQAIIDEYFFEEHPELPAMVQYMLFRASLFDHAPNEHLIEVYCT